MFFLMVCDHNSGVDDLRDALRAQHRDWIATGGGGLAQVLIGSALWDEAQRGTGNFGILAAADEKDARAFAEGDPFATGGVVKSISLTRLPDTFQAARIDPMTPQPFSRAR